MARTLTTAEKLDWLQLCPLGRGGPEDLPRSSCNASAARAARSRSCRGWRARRAPRSAGGAAGATRPRPSSRRSSSSARAARLGRARLPGAPRRDRRPAALARGAAAASTCWRRRPSRWSARATRAPTAACWRRSLARRARGRRARGISGLARGIDTAAHEGALAAGGATVAVIASGIDVPYPEDNAELMARIAASGAVVTERPLGAVPQARHFPRRNRLIAGLASASWWSRRRRSRAR